MLYRYSHLLQLPLHLSGICKQNLIHYLPPQTVMGSRSICSKSSGKIAHLSRGMTLWRGVVSRGEGKRSYLGTTISCRVCGWEARFFDSRIRNSLLLLSHYGCQQRLPSKPRFMSPGYIFFQSVLCMSSHFSHGGNIPFYGKNLSAIRKFVGKVRPLDASTSSSIFRSLMLLLQCTAVRNGADQIYKLRGSIW